MSIGTSSLPYLRVRVVPRFPARVEGANGIGVEKTNGVYTIGPRTGELLEVASVTPGTFVQVWDEDQDTYSRIPSTAFIGGGGGTGSVTSVALSLPTGFNVSGSPINTSGTLTGVWASGYQAYTSDESAKLAGIADGATANTGTVTSVALSLPAGFSVSGSPVTANGTLTGAWASGYRAYTDIEATKLSNIEALADVTDATNVAAAGAIMDGDFSSNGIMARTAAGTYTSRTITQGTGIAVTNGNGASGNPTVALSSGAQASLSLADTSLQPAAIANMLETSDIGASVQAYSAALGQVAALGDPNADRIIFWDDSAGTYAYLTVGTNLTITGTTLNATAGGGGGGDMYTAVYDPNGVADDAFDMDNMAEGMTAKILTATERSKLSAIEANADVTDATNVAAAGAFMKSADTSDAITAGTTNLFMTPTERSKLAGVATGATANTGTVTSVQIAVPTGFTVSGGPLTTSGTITMAFASGYQGYTATEASKLSGIATGATANSTDAALLNRANHTGSQAISTVTNLQTTLDGKASTAAVTTSVNGLMIASDKVKLNGIATGATANDSDANLKNRANHTGTQAASTITGLATVATSGAYGDLSGRPALREVLTADRTYYVRTDGSDSNTGLANTAGGAFLTVQKALNVCASIDFRGYVVTIQIADGTYSGEATVPVMVGQAALESLVIKGNAASPQNVVLSGTEATLSCLEVGARCYVQDVTITSSTSHALRAVSSGQINFSNVRFGVCGGSHIYADRSGVVTMQGDYAIVGGAAYHINAWNFGVISVQGSGWTVTLTGTPAFSQMFANARYLAKISAGQTTWSGSATGKRYVSQENSVISVAGGGANYLPGNAAGTSSTGGLYI